MGSSIVAGEWNSAATAAAERDGAPCGVQKPAVAAEHQSNVKFLTELRATCCQTADCGTAGAPLVHGYGLKALGTGGSSNRHGPALGLRVQRNTSAWRDGRPNSLEDIGQSIGIPAFLKGALELRALLLSAYAQGVRTRRKSATQPSHQVERDAGLSPL
jgi:hypothetical protein